MSRNRDIEDTDGRNKDPRDRDDQPSIGRVDSQSSEDRKRERENQTSMDEDPDSCLDRRRETIRMRDREYEISPSDLETLEEIGKFRAVDMDDLAHFQFNGEEATARYDLRRLREQGLLQVRRMKTREDKWHTVVVLTKQGKELVEREGSIQDRCQSVFAGFVKPAELEHDLAIYRMYQAEAKNICSGGGAVKRVILDYELKKKVYAPLARARAISEEEYRNKQREIAQENGLDVVEGKVLLPDLRIEYEARDGEITRVDLELATEHYKQGQLAAKAQAGFKIYMAGSNRSGGSAVFDDPELAARIISL